MKISVIIPVYNAQKYLNRCIDSVFAQTYDDFEIIAVDDGSTDGSLSILKSYTSDKIKVISQENLGPGAARNTALNSLSGDYIVFLDADDYIEPDYFEELNKTVETTSADVVFTDVIQEKADGSLITLEKMSSFSDLSKKELISSQMTGKLPWGACRKAAKAEIIKKNDIKFSSDDVGEEAVFSFRLLHDANRIEFIKKTLYHYVNYPASQSKKGDDDPWGAVVSKMKCYLEENGLLEEYERALNAFAVSSMAVSAYRISSNAKTSSAVKKISEKVNEYKKLYDLKNYDKNICEKRVILLNSLIRFRLYRLLALISKIKNRKDGLYR